MKKLVAGIDIGTAVTSYALVDEFGKIYTYGQLPTEEYKDFDTFITALKDEIDALSNLLEFPHKIEAIGIGAPNGNYYTGEINNAANLVWKGKLPIAKQLSALFKNIPTVLTNDANAAAIGEMIYGGAKNRKNFVVITLDTGLGSGIVVDGHVVYGHDGAAGELGHVKIANDSTRACGCGRSGCLETFVSIKGLKLTVLELIKENKLSSKLSSIAEEEISFEQILKAVKSGDALAKEAFNITGAILGEALANLVALTAPDYIFISGPMSKAGEFIIKPARKALEDNLMNIWKGKVNLLPSVLDTEKAPILGAAALAIKEIQKRSQSVGIRKVI